eukprot:364987-Chlamydomonas_euryale.AAC.1
MGIASCSTPHSAFHTPHQTLAGPAGEPLARRQCLIFHTSHHTPYPAQNRSRLHTLAGTAGAWAVPHNPSRAPYPTKHPSHTFTPSQELLARGQCLVLADGDADVSTALQVMLNATKRLAASDGSSQLLFK